MCPYVKDSLDGNSVAQIFIYTLQQQHALRLVCLLVGVIGVITAALFKAENVIATLSAAISMIVALMYALIVK